MNKQDKLKLILYFLAPSLCFTAFIVGVLMEYLNVMAELRSYLVNCGAVLMFASLIVGMPFIVKGNKEK